MHLKDQFSEGDSMTKRTNRTKERYDEESSDEVGGLTCQHVSKAVDLSTVKKAVTQSVWLVCSDCMKERTVYEETSGLACDVLVCLRCGFQGCNQSECQHARKHQQALQAESHFITISLSTWKAWCSECNDELSIHCNKKVLAQALDFLKKHSVKTASGSIFKLQQDASNRVDPLRGKNTAKATPASIKGISNLGNTCFFNAVVQNLSQTHLLNELISEAKDKGHKMKIVPPPETNLGPLTIMLPSPAPLTSALFQFLHNMKEAEKDPISPKLLFSQLCQKAPCFKGYQQQDSQELLHYLLDSVRMEEIKRIKTGILKAFNNPTEKTADEETKQQVKAYGKEAVKMNFVDRIFVGELTNTIMCEECENITTIKEAFIDISLPIIEERTTKRTNPGKACKNNQKAGALLPHEEVEISHNKHNSLLLEQSVKTPVEDSGLHGSSSNDADSEASESESTFQSQGGARNASDVPGSRHSTTDEQLVSAVSRLGLDENSGVPQERTQHEAFQHLAHNYTPSSKECSVQSCLYQFTSVELLMSNNKLLCERCTESKTRRATEQDKKTEKVYTSARKQMLISTLPPVVTLHLKRFHQAGMCLRKVNRHVDFPFILDLAPFCSPTVKSMMSGKEVLYSLYGVVEHSGSMGGGHYAAYVKVRPTPRRQEQQQQHLSGPKENNPLPGRWMYISDTNVQSIPETRVLNSQAYLLFYEELL